MTFFVFSGGFYAIFWVSKVGGEINFAEEKEVFPLDKWLLKLKVFAGLLILVFLAMVAIESPYKFLLFLVLFVYWVTFFFQVLLSFGHYIHLKDNELKTGKLFSTGMMLLFFWPTQALSTCKRVSIGLSTLKKIEVIRLCFNNTRSIRFGHSALFMQKTAKCLRSCARRYR